MSRIASINRALLSVVLCTAAAICGRVVAQGNPTIELKEAQMTLQASSMRLAELEGRLTRAKEQMNALAEALATANGDSAQARDGYERLRVQMEGLGVAALDPSHAGLQERLLVALSDLRIMETQKRQLANALMDLSEAALGFAKVAGPIVGAPRETLHAKLAAAEKALRSVEGEGRVSDEADLQHARIVSLKENSGVAVLNIGARHGVHPGMPFSIYREDKPVARALVVDVRQGICGVVIQELVDQHEAVRVGDTGKVEPEKS